MSKIIEKVEDIVSRQLENDRLKDEISELKKMLKLGFEGKFDGFDKVPKTFSDNDEKKIKKMYDVIGNQVKALQVAGSIDKFVDYMKINFGIEITVGSTFPNVKYTKNEKKYQKFYDIYGNYFLADVPKSPDEAIKKIITSLENLHREYKNEEEPLKEELKAIEETENQSAIFIKTLNKILKTARKKSETVINIAGEIETQLNEQQKAVDMIEG